MKRVSLPLAFVLGVMAAYIAFGQPAKAQVQQLDSESAIKQALVESIRHHHSLLRGDLETAVREGHFYSNPYGRAITMMYFEAIAPLARDKPLVGHYLRYMAPVLRDTEDIAGTLLQDRYLDHFASALATTGLPPAFPTFTDSEIVEKNRQDWMFRGAAQNPAPWPYGWAARVLLGEQ